MSLIKKENVKEELKEVISSFDTKMKDVIEANVREAIAQEVEHLAEKYYREIRVSFKVEIV